MKKFIVPAAMALMLSVSGAAFAGTNTTITPDPNAPAGGNGNNQTSTVADPGADTHTGNKTDYRLSCPYLSDNPTVSNCRNLYTPPK